MRALTALLLAAFLPGCAKFPDSGTFAGVKRLTFSMTVAGQINPNYVYIFAIQPSTTGNPTTTGPIPVISQPWGNGFVAGNCTYYVRYDPTTTPTYTVYQFRDGTLLQSFAIGAPVGYTDPGSGGQTLTFQLDLTEIAGSTSIAQSYQALQVNFLTMDHIPTGSDTSKVWDALGDETDPAQINSYVNIPLTTNGTYNNLYYHGLEPKGDCANPDLDITDFSVVVASQ